MQAYRKTYRYATVFVCMYE